MRLHRWAKWIDDQEVVNHLWNSKDVLKRVWEWDQRHPTSYPMNTSHALIEIRQGLSKKLPTKSGPIRMPEPKKPKTLAELVPEKLVKALWEDQHTGTFEDAIRKAIPENFNEQTKSWKVFQSILRAVERAYGVSVFGLDVLPKPKISVVHRGLRQIAKAAGLGAQADAGFAEFLDDLCPCGIKNHKEAVRKLSSRSGRTHRRRMRSNS